MGGWRRCSYHDALTPSNTQLEIKVHRNTLVNTQTGLSCYSETFTNRGVINTTNEPRGLQVLF